MILKKQNPRSEGKDYCPREMKRSSGLKPAQASGCEPPGLFGRKLQAALLNPGEPQERKIYINVRVLLMGVSEEPTTGSRQHKTC